MTKRDFIFLIREAKNEKKYTLLHESIIHYATKYFIPHHTYLFNHMNLDNISFKDILTLFISQYSIRDIRNWYEHYYYQWVLSEK